jgi:hypothetical protein
VFHKFVMIMVLCMVAVSLLVGCGSSAQPVSVDADPKETVQGFYDWYLGDRSGPPKDARESGYLHSDLVARIDEMMESPVPVDMISFVCAQDIPDYVEVVSSDVQGENAEVLVKTSFGGNVRLFLWADQDNWRIIDVKCE